MFRKYSNNIEMHEIELFIKRLNEIEKIANESERFECLCSYLYDDSGWQLLLRLNGKHYKVKSFSLN